MKICIAFFLTTAVLVVAGETEKNEAASYQYEYQNLEARDVRDALQEYITSIYVALEEYLQGLSTTCSTALSLQEYNKILKSAENSECTEETPKGYNNAETTIAEAASKCRDSQGVDDLAILIEEVDKAQSRVQSLDKLLSKNTQLCVSKALDKKTCVNNKKRIVDQLDEILSHSGSAKFGYLLRNAYFNTKKAVDECMDSETKKLKTELDFATKTIKVWTDGLTCPPKHGSNALLAPYFPYVVFQKSWFTR